MAKILIVGCGAIGYELANVLAEAGHEVSGLKRNPPTTHQEKFQYIKADITIAADLDVLPPDFEHVIFIVSADSRNENSYREIYETGINNLIDKFAQSGTSAPWIFVSSTSVYGQTKGEWVDENSLAIGSKDTSRKIVAAEQLLMALNPENVIVRFSGIYGPGREYLLRMALQAPIIQQNPPYFTNRVHQTDCVGVLAFLLQQRIAGVSLQQCYLVSDDEPAPLWEVISWLAENMPCSPPSPIDNTGKNNPDMNKRCRNNRIKKLGYQFHYPNYKKGYLELINLGK